MRRNLLLVLLLAAMAWVPSARASEPNWVGKTILVKKGALNITRVNDSGDVVNVAKLNYVSYRVLADKGDWIKLSHHGAEGWLEKTEAVLLEDAVEHFTNRIHADPKDASAYNSRATAWKLKGELDIALKDFEEAIRLDPKAYTYTNRGIGWHAKKEYDKAIKDYDEAIRLDPKYASAYSNRGSAWSAKKEHDKAIRDFDETLRLEPRHVHAYRNRGLARADKKEYDAAIADFAEAIRIDPKNPDPLNDRGNVWFDKKEYDKAIKDYDEAIRVNPKYKYAFINRGLAWSRKKEHDKAIRDYDEAIRLDPADMGALSSRAWSWMAKKEYDKAISDFNEVVRLDAKAAYAYRNRALAWENKKDYDKAISDYDEAILLDPKYTYAYLSRGWSRISKKEYNKALKDYDEAVRLDPKSVSSLFNRAVAQMLMRHPEAADGFQRVLDLQGFKGDRALYSVIFGHLAARQAGQDSAAKRFLSDSVGKLDEIWPYPAVKFLRGEIDEAALMKLATDDDKRTEAHCYLGLDFLAKGRLDEALAHFRWVKEKGTYTFFEYKITLAELDRLEPRAAGFKP